jgi:hypothetical protein
MVGEFIPLKLYRNKFGAQSFQYPKGLIIKALQPVLLFKCTFEISNP